MRSDPGGAVLTYPGQGVSRLLATQLARDRSTRDGGKRHCSLMTRVELSPGDSVKFNDLGCPVTENVTYEHSVRGRPPHTAVFPERTRG